MFQMTLAAQQKSLVGLSEGKQKNVMANRAYQQWLLNKKAEEQQMNKEKRKALQENQRQLEQTKAQISFSVWKRRKDVERELKSESIRASLGRENPVIMKPTPLLPGYCSVWSCDEELADHMLHRVHRHSQIS